MDLMLDILRMPDKTQDNIRSLLFSSMQLDITSPAQPVPHRDLSSDLRDLAIRNRLALYRDELEAGDNMAPIEIIACILEDDQLIRQWQSSDNKNCDDEP